MLILRTQHITVKTKYLVNNNGTLIFQRLQKEAIELGSDLRPINQKAFETTQSTKIVARQLGLMD